MTKKELRQHLRSILEQFSPKELHARSVLACQHLIDTPEYDQAEIIMIFLSLPTEVDTTPLALQAWRDHKRVLAPKVSWEQRRMLPTEIRSLSDDVSESPMGIREPAQGMPIPVGNIDLVIVPGLGFDGLGNRVGRGRGFYDRFLAHRDWKGAACGLALHEQVVNQVPTRDHDMKVDLLATDQQVHRFGNRVAVKS